MIYTYIFLILYFIIQINADENILCNLGAVNVYSTTVLNKWTGILNDITSTTNIIKDMTSNMWNYNPRNLEGNNMMPIYNQLDINIGFIDNSTNKLGQTFFPIW